MSTVSGGNAACRDTEGRALPTVARTTDVNHYLKTRIRTFKKKTKKTDMTNFYAKDQDTMLKLFKRDEMFGVALGDALYFKAEGHYTNVFFYKDSKLLLPFGLSQVNDELRKLAYGARFVKIGRSHIINLSCVVHASITKECFTLIDRNGAFVTVVVSKNAIKQLTGIMKGELPVGGSGGEGLAPAGDDLQPAPAVGLRLAPAGDARPVTARGIACSESGGVKLGFSMCLV